LKSQKTMRNLLFGLLFFMTSCSGQQNPTQLTQIDTAKLFDPKPQADNPFGDTNMFQNCIVIQPAFFGLALSGQQHKINNVTELKEFVKKNSLNISRQRFYIVCDSSTSFKKIVDVIDVVKSAKIDNYRVINVQSYFKSPEPIIIQTPTIVAKKIDKNDSTYFNIEIAENDYQVSFLNKRMTFKTSMQLDKFISENKGSIDKQKILVTSSSKTQYERLKPVIEILKQNDFLKFQMVTK